MTTRDTPCPDCIKPKGAKKWKPNLTQNVSRVLNERSERYSVCVSCHDRQKILERKGKLWNPPGIGRSDAPQYRSV